ncbi:hypothetical protein OIDMADRAFT_107806 [Oidiodendron maius Zn]|uniref:Uncharacterized protein n=1 Tax=Oidiodendron maius (strain Zn) TaxID=913774 RepID=A0A0C3HLW4_OIDMZ|nr:hypothetical protein OIDMADRAFT_107806 [Oidiodendron maius Zn]
MALQGQRASIARNAAKRTSHPHIPTAEDICTTLMLLYYELIRPSVIGSWLGHLRGLGQMIFLLGPQNCQSGVLHLFFRALRLLMAYYSAWTCTSSFLASQEWATVPFAQAGTTACDDVVTVLLSLPSLIEDSRKTHLPMHRRAGSGFIFEVTLPRLIENMKMSEGHEEQEKYQDHDKWVPASGDFCAAVPLTVWQASSILLIHGGLQQNGFVSNNLLNRSITSYCDLILEFSRSVCRNHTGMINAGSCIQLVFPLEIVIRYSPLESQVSCARGVLNSLGWGDVNVMHEI